LSLLDTCSTCGGYARPLFGGEHVCPPMWEAHDPDTMDAEDSLNVRAFDAEMAAQKAAQRLDESGGEGFTEARDMLVRQTGQTKWQTVRVTAAIDVRYSAREVA
jgi:hypothetical protein